jgi:hypothetical protein
MWYGGALLTPDRDEPIACRSGAWQLRLLAHSIMPLQ